MERRVLQLDDWQDTYHRKLVSPEEAARVIKSGDSIFIPSAYSGSMPYAIVERKDDLHNVKVEISSPLFDPGWLSPGMEESFEVIVRTYLATAREAHDEGRIAFLPYTNGSYFIPYRDHRTARISGFDSRSQSGKTTANHNHVRLFIPFMCYHFIRHIIL